MSPHFCEISRWNHLKWNCESDLYRYIRLLSHIQNCLWQSTVVCQHSFHFELAAAYAEESWPCLLQAASPASRSRVFDMSRYYPPGDPPGHGRKVVDRRFKRQAAHPQCNAWQCRGLAIRPTSRYCFSTQD